MAIIKQRGLQLRVATISDRNNIVKRPEHLVVHVDDAIADPLAGVDPAIYKWTEASGGKWLLLTAGGVADSVDWSGVINKPTTLNGYDILDAATSTHIHTDASVTVSGFMSASDKTKLNGLSNYVKPVNEPISYITGLQTALDAKATTTALDTEKARIDAILTSASANTDTFAEIVTLINSVDTTNDSTFAGYVSTNDSRSTAIETNVTNLTNNKVDKTNVQTLHATDALRNVGSVISLYKGDGTFESITVPDTLYIHPDSGVIAGTYRSVTVNAQGHITGGTNPTTLAGYGITIIDCGSIV